MFEYLIPHCEITIGGFAVQRYADLQIVTGRSNPVDRARLALPAEGLDPAAVQRDAEVTIKAGYREKGLWDVFVGKVVDVAWSQQVVVLCKDRMDAWREKRHTKAFVDTKPREVVAYCLWQAGVAQMKLSDSVQTKRHYFVLRGQNLVEAVSLVNRTWGLNWRFYAEPSGEFVWGPWEESDRYAEGEVVRFERGVNVLELTPFTGEQQGVLKTIFLPYLRHSQLARVVDNEFWGRDELVRVERVFHHLADKKARTTVQWTLPS